MNTTLVSQTAAGPATCHPTISMITKTSLLIVGLTLSSLVASRGATLSQAMQDAADALRLGTNAALGVSITQQPVSQTVAPGATVVLSVAATGPSLQYQWSLNGDVIPGATTASLTLNNVQADICGSYQATVYNSLDMDWSAEAYVQVTAPARPFADSFANRGVITTAAGIGSGTTQGAFWEPSDPRPDTGWIFGTVWLTWVAPGSGPAHIDTIGSGFDSWLGVYTGTRSSSLVKVATDDDSGGFHTSHVEFNALAGTAYQIMVASRDFSGGPILFSWNLAAGVTSLPTITTSPTNITTKAGSPASLSVQFSSMVPPAIQWYHNGQPIAGANQNTLQWSQLTVADLGSYQVNLTSPYWVFSVNPVEIQFNSEGLSTVAARNKLTDAVNAGLVGQ